MRKTSMISLLLLICRLSAFAQSDLSLADPLSGKFLHVLGGMVVGLVAAGVVDVSMDPAVSARHPWMLPAAALAGSAVAGIGKELLDATGFGDPQFTDILITSCGGLAAALMVGYTRTVYPNSSTGQVNSASFIFSLAALLALPVVNGFMVEIRRYEARSARSPNAGRL